MKPGDIFSKMTPELRMRKVASKAYHFQEVYQDPQELLADLSAIIASLDKARAQQNQTALDLRAVLRTKDEILVDLANAFKKFDHAFSVKPPDLPIMYEATP